MDIYGGIHMIKYENRIKIHEIRRLIEENQYIQAAHIVDTLELSKIKSITDLSVIADVLIQNERFDDALQVLSKVYTKSKTRRILYQLVDLSIKSKNAEEAEKYLLQYMKVAPQDSYRFIFRYCIDKLKNEPFEILIESLEELKEYDYIEKWAYELAKLYHKAGKKDKCVCECSDIILWFGDGLYVEKAKLLKGYYVGEIDPIRMLKATEKKEAEKRLGLDRTKDYSSIKSEIDKFIANEEIEKNSIEDADISDKPIDSRKAAQTYITEEIYKNQNNMNGMSEEERYEKVKENHKATEEKHEVTEEMHEMVKDTYAMEETYAISDELYDTAETAFLEDKMESVIDEKLEHIFSKTNLDYHKLFGYFIHNDYCRSEIANFLDNILSNKGKQNHLMICGNKRSGKTTLAKEIAKALYSFGLLYSSRIAKISASKINYINLDDNYDKLKDCTLLIEEAGSLNSKGMKQLISLMRRLEGHIFVILEDSLDLMDNLLYTEESIQQNFEYKINLPSQTREDLFHFANYYIKENDYQLSNSAGTLLKNIINEIMNTEKEEDRLAVIMKLVSDAKLQADKRYKEELVKIIGSQKLSETDFLYINAEDFESVYGEE